MTARLSVSDEATLTTEADAHPLVAAAKTYALEVLKPAALETDRTGVGQERIDQLRALGLLERPWGPGSEELRLASAADRRIHEHIAYGCINTWLVWAQHFAVTARLVKSLDTGRTPGELEQSILAGEILSGAGLSDVRGFPNRYISAARVSGGWRFDGTISWVSGWGLGTGLAVAGVEAESRTVVMALIPIDARIRATHLDLRAAIGSRTERAHLDAVFVPDRDVVETTPLDAWKLADSSFASNAGPHMFALASAVLDELAAEQHPLVLDVVATWRPRLEQLRSDAYELAALAMAQDAPDTREERVALKVATGEVLSLLTRALVVARSGRALTGDNVAQMHARNALFVLVQGQTAAVKATQLARLAEVADEAWSGVVQR